MISATDTRVSLRRQPRYPQPRVCSRLSLTTLRFKSQRPYLQHIAPCKAFTLKGLSSVGYRTTSLENGREYLMSPQLATPFKPTR
ncbi:hypothetical protein CISG_07523 [Coccidioides immitis RMSCC 3703]|uniref:Uncharacterized protein n=2 Tax=Coccidioides immitis TaxID=5501 RepID=A0A0J8R436_COCIT|nr:hypothetical protein CIRG_05817 [Coccidioides immitis RMSCC 2394]KMU79160.1 hypothetical protein CISG_07523 [Coccidioides immitis RMSCC 3703]